MRFSNINSYYLVLALKSDDKPDSIEVLNLESYQWIS